MSTSLPPPNRPAFRFLSVSVIARALRLAGMVALLPPTLAWAAPAGAPGTAAAPAPAKAGDACPVPGRLTAADGSLRGFAPSTDAYLEVDGKEVPAEIFHIDTSALLLISPRLASPVLVKAFTVAALPLAKIEKQADGTVDVRPDAELRVLGTCQATFDTVSFKIGGHRQTIRKRPPLDFLRAPGAASPPS